jgi:CHRD domain
LNPRANLFRLGVAVCVVVFLVLTTFGGTTVQAKTQVQTVIFKCPDGTLLVEGSKGNDNVNPLNPLGSLGGGQTVPITVELPQTLVDPTRDELIGFCHFLAVLDGFFGGPPPSSLNGNGLAHFATGAGDPDGRGMLLFYHDTKTRQTCYMLVVEDIKLPATGAQIHAGEAGKTGDAVLTLKNPGANGKSQECFALNAKNQTVLDKIIADPTQFYVEIQNKEFPNGALRGQMLGAFKLDGMKEAPKPGDRDGYGVGATVFDEAKQQVCYGLIVAQIMLPATEAHIHLGKVGEAGDVVLPLTAPDKMGISAGCINVGDKFEALAKNRYGLYINVHTKDFPNGAIRGQPPY